MSSTFPGDWLRVTTIDAHTAGEPLRIISDGWPEPPGQTILEKRRHVQQHDDHLRKLLILEPRGHADMYGCLLTQPVTPDGHVGVLFMHNEGYSTMCGHGIIGLVKVGVELDLFDYDRETREVRIDTPAGRVTARPEFEGESVRSVSFENVPSFVLEEDLELQLPQGNRVRATIAFGGAFYAFVDTMSLDLRLVPEQVTKLIARGREIKAEVNRTFRIEHPLGDPDMNFLYGTVFIDRSSGLARSRNVCIFAEGEVDRSPTGTGVSGRAAIHFARNEIKLGESLEVQSILGTVFEVTVVRETRVGSLPAVIPRVRGSAHITGRHEFVLDPRDDLSYGFLLR